MIKQIQGLLTMRKNNVYLNDIYADMRLGKKLTPLQLINIYNRILNWQKYNRQKYKKGLIFWDTDYWVFVSVSGLESIFSIVCRRTDITLIWNDMTKIYPEKRTWHKHTWCVSTGCAFACYSYNILILIYTLFIAIWGKILVIAQQ